MKKLAVFCALVSSLAAARVVAEDAPAAKLKGLWVAGGCCHDYKKHAPLLTEKIGEYANAGFKIVMCDKPADLDMFKYKDYAKDYDLVVYDLCHANVKDKEIIDNITRTIREGNPAVIVHCSLHNFRAIDWDDWREAMGMTSKAHDKFRALETKKVADHPTTKFWPTDWKTPGDELYQTIKLWPNATALMTVHSPDSDKNHTVTWVNQYGKGRVFATTLGHNMLTVGQEEYQHLLANGVLWVCGKLDDQGRPAPGYEGTRK